MQQHDPSGALAAGIAAYGIVFTLLTFAIIIILVVAQWRIVPKAGYNGALSLLAILPFVNIIFYLVFAFNEWPIERELRAARNRGGGGPPTLPSATT